VKGRRLVSSRRAIAAALLGACLATAAPLEGAPGRQRDSRVADIGLPGPSRDAVSGRTAAPHSFVLPPITSSTPPDVPDRAARDVPAAPFSGVEMPSPPPAKQDAALPLTEPADDAPVVILESARLPRLVGDVVALPVLTMPGPLAGSPPWSAPARPGASLRPLYVAFGVLQGLDVYTTRVALKAGAREGNPLLPAIARRPGALIAAKAASAFGTVYVVERMRIRHPVAAAITMAAIDSAYAVMVTRNADVARQARTEASVRPR
jgi:hypothetical protein